MRHAGANTRLPSNLIKAAAMLHTEAALTARDRAAADLHIERARAALDSVSADEARRLRPFVDRWHALAVVAYATVGEVGRAHQEVDRALRENIENVDARLANGALYEMDARFAEPNLRGRWNNDDPKIKFDVHARLAAALTEYNKILAIRPTFLEARLRLGWVLFLEVSSSAHIREQLEKALASNREELQYLAHLFLGALEERDNYLDAAAKEYTASHSIAKRQSSFLALIRVDQALGRNDEAANLASDLVATPDVAADDPWKTFSAGLTGGELIEWLRHEAQSQ